MNTDATRCNAFSILDAESQKICSLTALLKFFCCPRISATGMLTVSMNGAHSSDLAGQENCYSQCPNCKQPCHRALIAG